MKKFLITTLAMCLSVGIAHANPTEKQKIIEMVKSQDDGLDKVYSSDGKRFYQKEMTINDKGGLDVRVREKYLPAVTDGKTYTPKSSYFAFSPKVMKYAGKVARGANAVGIGLLMVDILGEGVDWVLDPANNSVTYTTPVTSSAFDDACYKHFSNQYKPPAHNLQYARFSRHTHGLIDGNIQCLVKLDRFPEWDMHMLTPIDKDTRVMSDEELEQKIKELAKAGNINAKQVILDAGKDEIADGKHDEQIERLADDITSDTADEPQPDPDNPPTDDDTKQDPKTPPDDNEQADEVRQDRTSSNFELPPFCSWATVVCDFIDWVRQEPPQEQTPQNVPKKGVGDIPELSDVDRYKERIDFQGQCPTGQISFGINGTQYSYVMPYTHFCQLLEQLAPWLLAFAYLSTAYFIVSNL